MSKSITLQMPLGTNANARSFITAIQNTLDHALNSAGLAIGTDKTKVLIANTTYALFDGALVKKTTAEIAFTATTHDVTADKFRIFRYSMSSAGTITVTAGVEGATLAAATWPAIPAGDVAIGYVTINPTGTGNFDATTTELDDATVVPNAVYVNTATPQQPTLLLTV